MATSARPAPSVAIPHPDRITTSHVAPSSSSTSAAANTTAAKTDPPAARKASTSTSTDRAAESDDELNALSSTHSRDRLGSESSSRASKKNVSTYNKAGSTTSKSSGSTRRRQDSLKRGNPGADPSTTPKRGTPATVRQHTKTLDAFAPFSQERKGSQFRVGNVGAAGRIYLTPVTKPSNGPSSPVQSPQSRIRHTPRVGTREGETAVEEEDEEDHQVPQQQQQQQQQQHHQQQRRRQEEEERARAERKQLEEAAIDDSDQDDHKDVEGDDSILGSPLAPTKKGGAPVRESVWTKLSSNNIDQDVRGAPSDIFRHRPRSQRSMSESTASRTPLHSTALTQTTKAFKVVIDRPDSDPAKQQQQRHQSTLGHSFSGLDISIPNYKMGSPQFSDQGTPFLHSSTFGSATQPLPPSAITQSQFLERIPDGVPLPSNLGPSPLQRQMPSRRHSHASPYTQSIGSMSYDSVLLQNNVEPSPTSRQHSASTNDHIAPAIYDILAAAPNDPSVVRYSNTTGELIAATPARLIVQITAETFLDYELLSDFFLTVRSYLPIHDLMSLLLARFEWAVNRFDDNGRIIRVRSFAAIRHWILNYFAYDFVPDRRLRVQFCRKLNQLFKVVQSQREYGLPDLKLISDLKKCWNGRCVLYWERDQAIDNEADLLPGGPGLYDHESDFDNLDDDDYEEDVDDDDDDEDEEEDGDEDAALGSVTAASTDDVYSDPGSPRAVLSNGVSRDVRKSSVQEYSQSRNGSGSNIEGAPMSPNSEPSASPMVPSKQLRSAQKSGNKQRQRQSGGSSDIMRHDNSKNHGSAEQQPAAAYLLQASAYRSVLRGHLLAPASPYVTTATATPGFQRSSPILGPTTVTTTTNPTPTPPARRNVHSGVNSTGPAMKAIIGNIKRALSSKVSSGAGLPLDHAILMEGTAGINQNANKNIDTAGRNANHVEAGHNNSNNQQASASSTYAKESVRAAMRIDVLAEQISIEFQKALQGQYRQPARHDEQAAYQARHQQQLQQQRLQQLHQMYQQQQHHEEQQQQRLAASPQMRKMSWLSPTEKTKQVPSGMTSSSQSIFIIDATGDSANKPSRGGDDADGRTPRVSVNGAVAVDGGHALGGNHLQVSTRELGSAATSNAATPSRLSLAEPAASHMRQQPSQSSASLRRVASYQSALNRPSIESSRIDAAEEMVPDPSTGGKTMIPASAVPQKGLRRVPGGDLRANQNIADLEGGGAPLPRPKSTGSIATYASTAHESEMLSFGDRITKTFRDRNDRPLISPGIAGSFAAPFKKINHPDRDTVSTKATKVSYIRSQSDDHTGRRPSFEALVKSFADIPDEDEGGPEATLLKLEGRYHKGAGAAARIQAASRAAREQQQQRQRLSNATNGKRKQSNNSTDTLNAKQADRSTLASTDYAYSDSSFNSTPTLERDSMASPKSKGKGVADPTARSYKSGTDGRRRSAPRSFLLDDLDDSGSEAFTEDSRRPSNSEIHQGVGGNFGSPPANAARNQYLPTPDISPNRNFVERHIGQTGGPTSTTHPAVHAPLGGSGAQPKHMPFVLGHDSKVLCEQLTLIEKDALREIDWRDLVDMRWQQTPSSITNWVSYLMSSNPLGIDLVTARFNIMYKWVLSEIVLTESEAERALVIVKFIHIAREARRICNYATLLQFTMALTSNDCARLKKTWALVPKAERDALQELEHLISPHHNFVGLRSEMEDVPADQGCIPVLAVYIHDLAFNAQKPRMVEADLGLGGNNSTAGKRQTRHLINFERYRTTAIIVKSLLRLIDASSRYNFVPVDDVLSHCMWISSLPDEKIIARSRVIEGLSTGTQPGRNLQSFHK